MRRLNLLARLGTACVIAGALVAGVMFPFVGGVGLLSNQVTDSVDSTSTSLAQGQVPQMSTMLDSTGKPIAFFWGDQRRTAVASKAISQAMKLAIVSIEDKRFFSNDGVDWRGTMRAALTDAQSGQSAQGASTITQQYVKNYELLVLAQNRAQENRATADTLARKVRDVRVALTLDQQLSKDEILTRYLNLVPFGNGAYGIQAAAQTYFGINASALDVAQSAMLAGMVQSSSALDPYAHPSAVKARRDVVLSTMVDTGVIDAKEAAAVKAAPLGVLAQPAIPANGCLGAGDDGFFCSYALQYLATAGVGKDEVDNGGLVIRTTLNPAVQAATKAGVNQQAPADLPGVADVLDLLAPGTTSHPVLAMASSRTYGLDASQGQTVLGQPYTAEGSGAGSVFKVFTTAAALQTHQVGINTVLPTPKQLQLKGFGDSQGAHGCPAKTYCVKNYDNAYKSSYTVFDALAQSPNTAFVKLISEVGVTPAVDMAVKLGLRSYAVTPKVGPSIADFFRQGNLASFTLGVTEVNPLELSNVAATLASGGTWCPATPIVAVTSSAGQAVPVTQQPCEQVVDPDLAHSLANAMSHDSVDGTSAGAARSTGWSLPISSKTGTTDSEYSEAFLGFTNTLAGADLTFNDSPTLQPLCTAPLRQCPQGNLVGGEEPARSFFDAVTPIIGQFGPVTLPAPAPQYLTGSLK
ncbi:MAG: transglycosylase domain-containing protein [Mycobacteriaceae bacterium]